MKRKPLRGRFPLLALVLALLALALLALACEEEEEEVTPTPPVAETPTVTETPTAVTPTPAAPRPGDAGIPSNPREVRGLEGILTLDDGLAMWKERPADEDRTGVTADTIKLGRPSPITGWMAPYEVIYGPAAQALIKRVNEAGGIHGRKIELIMKDDKGDPAVTTLVAKEMVEADKVFALFFYVGSPAHAAIHDYHVEQKVPNFMFMDGSGLGAEPVTSKWDFGQLGSDIIGGMTIAEAVWRQDPDAKVAIVYMDFPMSVAAKDGIRYYAQQNGKTVVADFAHDITQLDLTPQAWQVAETDADWVIYHGSWIMGVSLIEALRETVGWTGQIAQWGIVPGDPKSEAAMDGTTMVTWIDSVERSPEKPVWAKLKTLLEEEGVTYTSLANQSLHAVEHLVRALELAGPDLTREGFIEALETGFTAEDNWTCSVCVGPTIYGPQDHWASEVWLAHIWNDATKSYEPLFTIDHETSKGLGPRGNYPGLECQPPSAEFPEGTCPWKEGS